MSEKYFLLENLKYDDKSFYSIYRGDCKSDTIRDEYDRFNRDILNVKSIVTQIIEFNIKYKRSLVQHWKFILETMMKHNDFSSDKNLFLDEDFIKEEYYKEHKASPPSSNKEKDFISRVIDQLKGFYELAYTEENEIDEIDVYRISDPNLNLSRALVSRCLLCPEKDKKKKSIKTQEIFKKFEDECLNKVMVKKMIYEIKDKGRYISCWRQILELMGHNLDFDIEKNLDVNIEYVKKNWKNNAIVSSQVRAKISIGQLENVFNMTYNNIKTQKRAPLREISVNTNVRANKNLKRVGSDVELPVRKRSNFASVNQSNSNEPRDDPIQNNKLIRFSQLLDKVYLVTSKKYEMGIEKLQISIDVKLKMIEEIKAILDFKKQEVLDLIISGMRN
ncbi:hypothetical protein KGF54_000388 [Candida jiufengensis]|uniref:uncharacterized protein n=1 Tax=Candida jiufengensis TaxID=497108 RepID=UPI002223FA7D|nr:uncharacterized protein KGF54_000388 [Candida jiufengensis]KAI5956771.1 hypothetical protein KGF54_000388 [Candida jiufengensis]